jgi:translation elongation factor EF-1alpha
VDIGLNGLISTVDLENSLAEISIGAANGVKQNMKFHVTRADKFICDIVILDVEPDNAIGTLELMDVTKEQPKTGDNVSTNL